MMRIRAGALMPALVFLAPLGGGVALGFGCIPSPDISGLPPYDGGTPQDGTFAFPEASQGDVTIPEGSTGGPDGAVDTGPSVGTITGVVIDYTQGNGQGVVPGATVSTAGGVSAISGADGAFTLTGVPAGQVLLNVGKATDRAARIAYSTTQVVVALGGGQTLNVFPVLHEGCVVTFDTVNAPIPPTNPPAVVDLHEACSTRTGAYAAVRFWRTSFSNASGTFSGTLRFELIPLAYPTGAGPDLSWALGLPGVASPIDALGAAEFRVVDDSNDTVLGLTGAVGSTPILTVPLYRTPGPSDKPLQVSSYNTATGQWTGEMVTPTPSNLAASTDGGALPPGIPLYDIPAPHLSWWTINNVGLATTSCVTGKLVANGSPAANVWVHGAGVNYLGSSSALTGADGTFCLDLKATGDLDGGAGQFGLRAGFASPTGMLAASANIPVSGLTAGSCAMQSNCTVYSSPITMVPVGSCVSGTVPNSIAPRLLDVELQTNVSPPQQAAGIRSLAYIGQVQLDDGGAFCAMAPNGIPIQLAAPGGCSTGSFMIPNVAAGSTCGGTGCTDAGTLPCGP